MTEETDRADRYWTAAFAHGGITTWMSEVLVRRAINERVTGCPDEWPMEWFQFEYCAEPFELGLSIGCGAGELERDVRRKNLCRAIVGVDISEGAIVSADQEAKKEGLEGISYTRADFNRLDLEPNCFDVVFFHQSMHHVAELEHCIDQVRRAMKPGAVLYLDEYIGPSRGEWSRSLVMGAERVLRRVPPEIRVVDDVSLPILGTTRPKPSVRRTSAVWRPTSTLSRAAITAAICFRWSTRLYGGANWTMGTGFSCCANWSGGRTCCFVRARRRSTR